MKFQDKRNEAWYEGMDFIKTDIKNDAAVAYDLVGFDTDNPEGFQREYNVYRLFSLGLRIELSVDHKYITPVFKDMKTAEAEWKKIEDFIESMIKLSFQL